MSRKTVFHEDVAKNPLKYKELNDKTISYELGNLKIIAPKNKKNWIFNTLANSSNEIHAILTKKK
jgi:hypothetical protein